MESGFPTPTGCVWSYLGTTWSYYAATHIIPRLSQIFPSLFSSAVRLNRCGRTEAWKVCPQEKRSSYLETSDANSYEPHSSSDTCLGKSMWKQTKVFKVNVWNTRVESRQLFSKRNMVKMGTSKRWHGKLHSSANCGLLQGVSTHQAHRRSLSKVWYEGWEAGMVNFLLLFSGCTCMKLLSHFSAAGHLNPANPIPGWPNTLAQVETECNLRKCSFLSSG